VVWLFVLSAAPQAISGYGGIAMLRTFPACASGPRPATSPEVSSATPGASYASMLSAQAPTFLLPVLVLSNVTPVGERPLLSSPGRSPRWRSSCPQTIGQVLLVEGRKEGADVDRQIRHTLALSAAVMAVGPRRRARLRLPCRPHLRTELRGNGDDPAGPPASQGCLGP